jgi:hypothetical protein
VEAGAVKPQAFSKAQLQHQLRTRLPSLIYDESGAAPLSTAVYTLADPRDAREIRYVGQTTSPQQRFRQHINTARLWLPDALPWWVTSPKLRPLYSWIRALYNEDGRLPVMIISRWLHTTRDARLAERNRIFECLEQRRPLLNVETELLGPQIPLL